MAGEVVPITTCILDPFLTGEKGMAQWWEHSPPTNVVQFQIASSTPRVGFVVGSLLCSERFFSGQSGFHVSSKTNISKFQFFIVRTDTCSHTELRSVSWVNKLQFTKTFSRRYDNYWSLHLRRWTCFSSHRKKICYCYYKYYFSPIIRNISLRTRPVISAALVTAHPPLPHPTKIFIVTNNKFCNWDVWYQKEPTHLNSSLQLLFLNRMARKVVIAEIPKTNGSLMSN